MRSWTVLRFAAVRSRASRTGRPWPERMSCTCSSSTTSRLAGTRPPGRRVPEVVVERDAAEQMVAQQEQTALGLVEDHMRRRVPGSLVDLPGAEVGLDLDTGSRSPSGRTISAMPNIRLAARLAEGPQSLGRNARLAGDLEAALKCARSGSRRPFVICAWFGCIQRRWRPVPRSERPGRNGPSARGCRPRAARAPAAAPPGRGQARADASSRARAGRCRRGRCRRPRDRIRVAVRHAGPGKRKPKPPQARAARGRRGPAPPAGGHRVHQHAGVEDPAGSTRPSPRAARRRTGRAARGRTRGGGRGRRRGGG